MRIFAWPALTVAFLLLSNHGQDLEKTVEYSRTAEVNFQSGAAFLIDEPDGTKIRYLRFPDESAVLIEKESSQHGNAARILDGDKMLVVSRTVGSTQWSLESLRPDASSMKFFLLLKYDRLLKAPWSYASIPLDKLIEMPGVEVIEADKDHILLNSTRTANSTDLEWFPFLSAKEKTLIKFDGESRIVSIQSWNAATQTQATCEHEFQCQYLSDGIYIVEERIGDNATKWQVEVIEHDWNDRSVLNPKNYGFNWPTESTANNQPAGYLMYYLLGGGALFLFLGLYLAYRKNKITERP